MTDKTAQGLRSWRKSAAARPENKPASSAHKSGSHLNYLAYVAGKPCSVLQQMVGEAGGRGNSSFQHLTMMGAERRLHLQRRRSETTWRDLSWLGAASAVLIAATQLKV